MSEFATTLRKWRLRAGFSQSQLARELEIAASYVSRLESGERQPARRELILALARVLQLSFDERNMLLIAAGYAPVNVSDFMDAHPSMKLLADILEDDQVPEDEKSFIMQQLLQVHRRWRERGGGQE